jgi:phosphoribosylglycinamide formyltransferase-1
VNKLKIVLLASGSGSLAQAIIDAIATGELSVEIAALISDKECLAIERARTAGYGTQVVPMRSDREIWNREFADVVRQHEADLVVSVGFMRILSPEFVREFKTINTHPALLPLFPGAHAVRDALAAGATHTGSTVHWVDAGVDTGSIIAQRAIDIEPGEGEEHLHERIKIVERSLIVEVLKSFTHELRDNLHE